MTIVVPVVKTLGPKANPAILKELPIASTLLWGFYAFYIWFLLLSTQAPGVPGFQTPPSAFERLFHESCNFFFINVGLNHLGIHFVPSIAEHPVDEALFNFVGAWGLLFLPVMLSDPQSQKMNRFKVWLLWVGTWVKQHSQRIVFESDAVLDEFLLHSVQCDAFGT